MTRSKTAKKKHVPRRYLGVMVSSTFKDLKRHRSALLDAIGKQKLAAVAMERDPALPIDLIDSSLRMVREAAAYIGVIAKRYGQVPKSARRNPKNVSLTELEFNEAIRLRRPILLFIMGERHRTTWKGRESKASQKKLNAFRERAKQMGAGNKVERVYATFESLKDFAVQAVHSVAELRRYLEEQHRDAEPARARLRAKAASAATPSRRSAAARPTIRFSAMFEVDQVSLVNARLSRSRSPSRKIIVSWPAQLIVMRTKVADLARAAQQAPHKRGIFSSWDAAKVARWVEDAHETLDRADEILAKASLGVDSILSGTRQHFHTRPDESIRNFTLLCVLAAGRGLADQLITIGRDDSLAEWRPYQNVLQNRSAQLRRLFACEEPVWAIKLFSVSNFDLGDGEYFYGPRSDIIEYAARSDAPIASRLFLRWIVPQLELMRVMKGNFAAVTYDQRATSSHKILDERAREVADIP